MSQNNTKTVNFDEITDKKEREKLTLELIVKAVDLSPPFLFEWDKI